MLATPGLLPLPQATALIEAGHTLCIAGDELALRQLPKGNWIGGSIPEFMAKDGGTVSRDRVLITPIAQTGGPATLCFYGVDSLPHICRNSSDYGYTLLIVPAFSECHSALARNAPNYEDMFLKPLVGWVAGMHLDDLGMVAPKVVLGLTGQFFEILDVAMDVPLPPEQFAQIDIVNLFKPGQGTAITFPETGFSAGRCALDGQPANLAEHLLATGADTRLPLVADYCGTMINVSIKAIDAAAGRVEFYAPVFPSVTYRIAAPVADYLRELQAALPAGGSPVAFYCNCILNYLYKELAGKRTAGVT